MRYLLRAILVASLTCLLPAGQSGGTAVSRAGNAVAGESNLAPAVEIDPQEQADETEPAQKKGSRKKEKKRVGENLAHKYTEEEAIDLTTGEVRELTTNVLAREDDWQSSGVMLKKGVEYGIRAEGTWKAGPGCRSTGGDGRRAATIGCIDILKKPVRKHSMSTLIAKIGEQGIPFAVGNELKLKADEDGLLFFRINDSPGMTWENEGFLEVTLALTGPPPQAPTDDRGIVVAQDTGEADRPYRAKARHWAVIIGISEYQDSRIPPLRYAARDATTFYDWVVAPDGGRYPPAQVRLLLNDAATAKNIREALFSWLGQAIEEDIVTIYFAGHGSPDTPDTPENLYLLPHDTQYDSIAATGFPMWDIETALERFIDARRVVVIADACHSGGVGEAFDVARRGNPDLSQNTIGAGLQDLASIGEGIAVISAADNNQFSYEGEEYGGGHGVFTYYLLEALKGEADYNHDERVTLGELIPFLSEQVRRATRNGQSPTIAGKFDPALSLGR